MTPERPSWEAYALALAEVVATRSEDPWLRVGAVALRKDHSIASTGYNGAPAGVTIDWENRDERRKRVIHAEANALRWCTPKDLEGGLVAVTHCPCLECVRLLAAYGVKRVVYASEVPNASLYDTAESRRVARDLGLELEQHGERHA